MLCTASAPVLTPQLLLAAYSKGIFPMANEAGVVQWYSPDPRAIFPLAETMPNKRFLRFLRNSGLRFTLDADFGSVMHQCATAHGDTWISEAMISAYVDLHALGHAHSVEAWSGDELVGGLYGVSMGGAFFGESMFSLKTNASKAAFFHLVEHLRKQGFMLFDTQILNDHTASLGAIEIPRGQFKQVLDQALASTVTF